MNRAVEKRSRSSQKIFILFWSRHLFRLKFSTLVFFKINVTLKRLDDIFFEARQQKNKPSLNFSNIRSFLMKKTLQEKWAWRGLGAKFLCPRCLDIAHWLGMCVSDYVTKYYFITESKRHNFESLKVFAKFYPRFFRSFQDALW